MRVSWDASRNSFGGLVDPAFADMTHHERHAYLRRWIWERDGRTCGICEKPVPIRPMDLDHVLPLENGGPSTHDNLRATHPGCNRSRHRVRQRSRGPRVLLVAPEEIRAARADLGMTQKQFADALGIPIGTLRNWEQGSQGCGNPILLRRTIKCLKEHGG